MKLSLPEVMERVQTPEQIEAFLRQIQQGATQEDLDLIRVALEHLLNFMAQLEQKAASIEKLRSVIFGVKTESARNLGLAPKPPPETCPKKKRKGHGRMSHRNYTGARQQRIKHPNLGAGQLCPECQEDQAKVYPWRPRFIVNLTATPPVQACVTELEQWRCRLCGTVFAPPVPSEASGPKYDPSVGVWVGLLRYGTGLPFYRLAKMQNCLGVPLPESVQWELAHATALVLESIYDQLIYLGAQAMVFYSDDTTMKITSVRQAIQAETEPKRTGIFTTAILCENQGITIRLLFTGREHAGENLAEVLAQRKAGLEAPLHMSDGLSRNVPKGQPVRPCQCNVHARRNFVEIRKNFPEECAEVVAAYSEVYRVEAQAREQKLNPQQRLELHQQASQPVMEQLKQRLDERLAKKEIEPNSELGRSVAYLTKRWPELTEFLRTPGAPVDNNQTEQLLKTAILHRKNSLHYKTQRGAETGDTFMSVIQTCAANRVNPWDYLLAVVRNAEAVKKDPGRWMPWNYSSTPTDPPAEPSAG